MDVAGGLCEVTGFSFLSGDSPVLASWIGVAASLGFGLRRRKDNQIFRRTLQSVHGREGRGPYAWPTVHPRRNWNVIVKKDGERVGGPWSKEPTLELLESELPAVLDDGQIPLVSMSDSAQKRKLVDFVVSWKEQVVKLHTVSKWSRDVDIVHKYMFSTDNILPKGPSSASDLGATSEDDGSTKPGLRKEKDFLDTPSVTANRAIHTSTATLDLPPQSRSLLSATDSDVPTAGPSLREPNAKLTGDHLPHLSHCQVYIIVDVNLQERGPQK
ncbi:hypothetical protein BJY52DRAFT_1351305 [Lactarius psammicola]|nr:hypothetical protein BJY52DRAFT_1351305 [Lactarius psammicola]